MIRQIIDLVLADLRVIDLSGVKPNYAAIGRKYNMVPLSDRRKLQDHQDLLWRKTGLLLYQRAHHFPLLYLLHRFTDIQDHRMSSQGSGNPCNYRRADRDTEEYECPESSGYILYSRLQRFQSLEGFGEADWPETGLSELSA